MSSINQDATVATGQVVEDALSQGAHTAIEAVAANSILTDLAAGTVGGLAGRLVEYPFDVIKTRLQTSSQFTGPAQCLRWTLQNQGLSGLYRGVSAPIAGAMLENSILFMTFEMTKKWILDGSERELTIGESMFAGNAAGMAVTLWLTPIELVKCRIQATHTGFSRPMDVVKDVYRNEGVRGFFRGSLATMVREGPGNAVYFGAYESAVNALCRVNETTRNEMPAWYSIVAGGIAGVCFTSSIFPADVIKSKMQTDMGKGSTFTHTLKNTLHTQGVRGLYPGLGITLLRTFPANAAIFFGYEQSKRLIQGLF